MLLSREEAQTLIYRGWGRLVLAMHVRHIPDHMAQKWEDGALQEAHAIIAVAKKGPVSSLAIPPLPLALIEVHRGLTEQRPLRPSDIHSPFGQARSSPWAKWVSYAHDEQIPPETDLGDASTFWWMSPEEKRSCDFTHYGYLRGGEGLPRYLPQPIPPESVPVLRRLFTLPPGAEKQPRQDSKSTSSKVHSKNNRASKRQRDRESSSEYEESEAEGEYIYVPKCDYCRDRGLACIAQNEDGQPARCLVCKEKKVRCSAIHGGNKAVKKSAMNKGPEPVKRSVVDMLLSQGTGSATRPPSSKRQRVFVDVPQASTSKVEQSDVAEPLKFGPPGGNFGHQLRTERATAAAAYRAADSLDPPFRQGVVAAPIFTSTPDTSRKERVMVEKGVSTENELSDRRDTRRKLKVSMSLIQEVIQKLEHNAYLD